jgi:Mg-chelatase subunit ChlD
VSGDDVQVRWRLVLGRFAQDHLPEPSTPEDQRRAALLDTLYERAHAERGVRGAEPEEERQGGLGRGRMSVPEWVQGVRTLFPRETAEVVERHALERFGLTELLTDPDFLERVTPDPALLAQALAFAERLRGPARAAVRRLAARVVEDLTRRLAPEVRRVMGRRLHRREHGPVRAAAALDVKGTLRRNLRHWDPERRRLGVREVLFFARNQQRLPWHVVLLVDQSASMLPSLIHATVVGAVLAGLPGLSVRMALFDTEVVDVSAEVQDPVAILMGVHLGGGTDIGRALRYAEQEVEDPRRTVVVVVSDFEEGADPTALVAVVRRMAGAGVKVLGLAALDDEARPAYDRDMASRLADAGMQLAALTPGKLAAWLAEVIR